MLKLGKVAVTGGLSSGKSTVCRFFKDLGAYVVSADKIVHQILSPETEQGKQVITLLGSEIVVEGQIDRSKIAQKVFNNPQLLKSLEKILHPAVRDEVEKCYQSACHENKYSLFIAEIPLLFEAGQEKFYDWTIAVVSDPKVSLQRFVVATGLNADAYKRRTANQLPPQVKARKASYVIINNGELAEMQEAVKMIYNQLIQ